MRQTTHLLRLLIENGDVSTPEAQRLAQDVFYSLPAGPDHDRLRKKLEDTLDVLVLADIIGVTDPSIERAQALRALDAIERELEH